MRLIFSLLVILISALPVKANLVNSYWFAVSSVNPLLDDYNGAAMAFSTRLLHTSYGASAIRVRRTSDSTEADIGFDSSGNLNGTALTSHCTGTNCFIAKWYDQSGNNRDATQTTAGAQPKIYDSSTGILTAGSNSHACIHQIASTDSYLNMGAISLGTTALSLYVVYEDDSAINYATFVGTTYSSTGIYHGSTGNKIFDAGNTALATRSGENRLNTSDIGDGTATARPSSVSLLTSISNGTVATATHTFKSIGSDDFHASNRSTQGAYCELIIYPSTSSSGDKDGIEANINSYWGLY